MQIQQRKANDVVTLHRRISREKNAEQRDRYRTVVLAIEGNKTQTIQAMLGRSRGFVQRWAYVYRDNGIEALHPARRGGSRSRLCGESLQKFIDRFTVGPTQADPGVCTLRGKDAVRILRQEFAVNYSLNGAYQLLHRHNLACLKPRPKHRKNDEQAMQRWVDSAPFLSSVCSKNIQTKRSKSGAKTKQGLASKER